jgi:predicted metal-dependent hydrolase
MKAREPMKTKQIKNFKMNDAVYKLRRQVIELIYEAKKEIKNLPRIEVRIGEARNHSVLGVARLKDNKIWITKKAIDMSQDALRNVVFHEIVHAVTGFKHDEKCPLMKSTLDGYLLNKTECIKYLKGYIKQGAAILSLQSIG